jgi:hypothetical protein
MMWIIEKIGARAVQGLVCATGIISLITWFAFSQQHKGAVKAVAQIEKATDNAIFQGKRAAVGSSTPSVRGQRDPTTRND